MYLYLVDIKYKKKWQVNLPQLRNILYIDENQYTDYKEFNRRILKKAQCEINQKTDIEFEYTPVRMSKKVVAIRFKLIKNNVKSMEEINNDIYTESEVIPVQAQIIPEENKISENLPEGENDMIEGKVSSLPEQSIELSEADCEINLENKYSSEAIEFLASSCDYEFSNVQMKVLFYILVANTNKLPPNELGTEFARYHYLLTKYAEMNLYEQKNKITNRFLYLKKMVENDLESK